MQKLVGWIHIFLKNSSGSGRGVYKINISSIFEDRIQIKIFSKNVDLGLKKQSIEILFIHLWSFNGVTSFNLIFCSIYSKMKTVHALQQKVNNFPISKWNGNSAKTSYFFQCNILYNIIHNICYHKNETKNISKKHEGAYFLPA